ncbi:MAG: 50S ribosomal protein L17 [Nitrospirae bacterium]|nr:50S ribosomal protein L17 [Nitrospirota bacterium]MBF0534288.1 50S ribosomal protein L17 [Nitrospirota bacterium]MBF0615731.1 50S ribosomal protein L17 [Nitrospirota bacterium]
MRHKVATRHFNRTANQRKALFRSLLVALIEYERIETTVTKAKAIKGMAEKMVTLGKRGDLHAKRIAFSDVPCRKTVAKLFSDIAPRFSARNGGYLRIIKTRRRLKDQAEMAVIEFVDYETAHKPSETVKGKK